MFLLVLTPCFAYNTYTDGNIQLSKVRAIINSVPKEYYRGLDNLYLFEKNCFVNKQKIFNDGYYYWNRNTHSVYLCNLNRFDYDGDEYALAYYSLHELAHHYEIKVLKHKELNETFANSFYFRKK